MLPSLFYDANQQTFRPIGRVPPVPTAKIVIFVLFASNIEFFFVATFNKV